VTEQLAPLPALERQHEAAHWPAAERRSEGRGDGTWRLTRAVSDVLALTIAGGASSVAASALGPAWQVGLMTLVVILFAASGTYRTRRELHLGDELRRVVGALGFACIATAAAAVLTTEHAGVGDTFAVYWFAAAAIVGTGRAVLYGAQRAVQSSATGASRTLIVGAGNVGRLTAERLISEPQLGLRPVGFLDKEPRTSQAVGGTRLPVLGASWDLEEVVATERIDTVIVAFSTAPHHVLLDLVRRSWKLGVHVMVVPRLYEVEGRRGRTETLGGLPLVALRGADPSGLPFTVKYAVDRVVAALILIAVAPLLATIALAVRLSLGRPILFRQQRVGRDGQAFEMLKFRTMHGSPEANGEADAGWAKLVLCADWERPAAAPAQAERRSRLGDLLRRLSLDELPQLWNVVRGDMSLVGPRPERTQYVEQFEDVVYRYGDRHRVKSGMTGWAQVHGLRGETSLADRIEWDNFYIENWSFWLDLRILALTVPAALGRRARR
jgi:exopolysaccharide biosynthesis polyprenyl glycosylphosphotransferase